MNDPHNNPSEEAVRNAINQPTEGFGQFVVLNRRATAPDGTKFQIPLASSAYAKHCLKTRKLIDCRFDKGVVMTPELWESIVTKHTNVFLQTDATMFGVPYDLETVRFYKATAHEGQTEFEVLTAPSGRYKRTADQLVSVFLAMPNGWTIEGQPAEWASLKKNIWESKRRGLQKALATQKFQQKFGRDPPANIKATPAPKKKALAGAATATTATAAPTAQAAATGGGGSTATTGGAAPTAQAAAAGGGGSEVADSSAQAATAAAGGGGA